MGTKTVLDSASTREYRLASWMQMAPSRADSMASYWEATTVRQKALGTVAPTAHHWAWKTWTVQNLGHSMAVSWALS